MKTEELWRQMEAEGGATGWSTRLARPDPGCHLLAAFDRATRTRALLLRTSAASIPPRREWPECRGLEVLIVAHGGDTYLGVRLRDGASSDVFAGLAEVLASRMTAAVGESEAVAELLAGLRRWQLFLAAARDGLSLEAQRGLFGELHLLGRTLVPALGPRIAVQGWKGFAGAHQDFQFPAASVEVKTTAASTPSTVRISSARQLDVTGAGELFLYVIVVDEREAPPEMVAGSETLAGLVAWCRTSVAAEPAARGLLDDGLLQAGWLDAYAFRYDVCRLTVRSQLCFHVRDGFPRLLEGQLPVGVTEVSYALDLSACRPFAVQPETMLASLVPGVMPASTTR